MTIVRFYFALGINLRYHSFKVFLRFVIGWNPPVNSSWIASDDKFWKPNAIKFASCVCLVVWAYFLISIRWAYSYFKKRCRRKSKKASRKDCKVMWIVYLWLLLEKSQSTKLAADFFIHHLYKIVLIISIFKNAHGKITFQYKGTLARSHLWRAICSAN